MFSFPKIGLHQEPRFLDPYSIATPLDLVRNRYVIDAYGGVHLLFELFAPALDMLSPEAVHLVQAQLVKLLTRLPTGIDEVSGSLLAADDYRILLRQHAEIRQEFPALDNLRQARAKRYETQCVDGSLPRFRTIISIGTFRLNRRLNYLSVRQPVLEEEFRAIVPLLTLGEEALRSLAQQARWRVAPLEGAELAQIYFLLACPERARAWSLSSGFDPESKGFLPSWLQERMDPEPSAHRGKGLLQIGGLYHSFTSLHGKPKGTSPGMIETATLRLPFSDFAYTLKVRRLDQESERASLKADYEQAKNIQEMSQNLADIVTKKDELRPPKEADNIEADETKREANELLKDLHSRKTSLTLCQATWHLWHPSPEECLRRRALLQMRLADLRESTGYDERDSLEHVFFSGLPGSGGPFLSPLKFRERSAADLFPISRGFETQDTPRCLLRNAFGGLVPFDWWNTAHAPAPFLFISGAMGSGKSVAANYFLLCHANKKARIFILDYGGSYDGIAEFFGASVLRFDANRASCLNVFQLAQPYAPSIAEPNAAVRAIHLACLDALLCEETESGLPTEEAAELVNLLDKTYAAALSSSIEFLTLSDLNKQVVKAGATSIQRRLRPLLAGAEFGAWFDGPGLWKFGDQAFVVDFKELKRFPKLAKKLTPLVMFLVLNECTRDPQIEKYLIFEELWNYVDNKLVMDRFVEFAKTSRKEGTALAAVTQSVGDLDNLPLVAKALKQCAQIRLMFEQGNTEERNVLQQLFSLTVGELDILKSLESAKRLNSNGTIDLYREALFVRGDGPARQSGRIRVALQPEEYWLFASNPGERTLRAQALEATNGDWSLALKTLAHQYPIGVESRA